ncbi:MAG: cation:proton antiporter [Dehalococcoidales bacterium]
MEGLGIGLDLLIVLATAIVGGMLARWLRLPVILGYLAGGIAIGPFGAGLVQDSTTINTLANIGVVLLLFAIGLEFSFKELLKLGKVSILGGITQIVLTAIVGFGLGIGVGLSVTAAIFFGFIISVSSTMVVLKLLMERGEIDTIHGRVMLGILLVQDLSVVPMMVAIPAVAGESAGLGVALAMALGKAVAFIAGMLALGYWFMPWVLKRVAGQRSRELFLLTVIVLCLAAAFGTYYVGLSAAFGAFVAGLLVSQSGYARQAFADILPLRDTFAALFFVSLGLVADRQYIFNHVGTIAIVVVAVILVKFLISSGITRIFGYSHKTVLMVGTGLISIGEFSFILALMGKDAGIFSNDFYHLIVAAAIITMFITPFAFSLNSFLYRWLSQKGWFARQLMLRTDPEYQTQALELSHHAVICGYGQVGRRIAETLDKQNFSYLVIELDPNAIAELRVLGVPCIYGDASNPEILTHAGLDKARVLLCTIPDYVAAELTVRNALKINPKLDIVARVHRDSDGEMLRDAGVTELVLPFFEGSLEMIRHTLHRFGMSSSDIQYVLNKMRQEQGEEKPKEKK